MELQERIETFEANDIGLLAVSVDPPATAKRMKEENNLTFPLLSDADRETIIAYDVLNEAANIATPTVFALDKSGVIRRKWTGDTVNRPDPDVVLAGALSLLEEPQAVSPRGRAASVWGTLKSQ